MHAVDELSPSSGTAPACAALGVARATLYRYRSRSRAAPAAAPVERRSSPRALGVEERQAVLATLHGERFVDQAPAAVYAALLDEGTYLCSERTMYRLLESSGEVRERRDQLRHPAYAKPELLASRPNEVWSWDITKLLGPAKWTYFYLYVLLDIYSRYVVGWMVAHRESATLAKKLIAESASKQAIARGQLTVHADRGSSMTSKPVALLLADLGVTKTHSRPSVSNDNPFSEAQFKTLKYRPEFPDRFGSLETRAPSASGSSTGTTTGTITRASRCSRRRRCITAIPRRCSSGEARPWRRLTRRIPSASCGGRRDQPNRRPRFGSTRRSWQTATKIYSKYDPASVSNLLTGSVERAL